MMNELLFLFEPQYMGYIWLVVGIIFLFAEMSTPGLFFFIAFAIGCVFSSIAAFLGYSLIVQCIGGLSISMIAFFVLRYYFSIKKQNEVGTNIDALVGQKGLVIQVIDPTKIGRVKVKGEQWPAQAENGVVLQKGTVVKIVKVIGNRLIVKG